MNKILVPCDFSKPAINAFRFALNLASRSHADIHVVHVIELPYLQESLIMPEVFADDSMMDELTVQSEKEFEKLLRGFRDQATHISHEVVFGQLHMMVLDSIEKNDIDLVIMGSHGASGVNEFFIGSNAERLVRISPVPVIVVKHLFNREIHDIVVPVTGQTEEQEDLINRIKDLQDLFKARLHLVWINTPALFVNDTITHDRLSKFATRFDLQNCTLNIFNFQNEEEGILHFAEMIDCDMIAMGTHGRKGLAHFLSGSTTSDIVNHARFLIWTYVVRKTEAVENAVHRY